MPHNAQACLHSTNHSHHACTGWSRGTNNVSLESPHNTMHGVVGGIMASYQSSFHPVFWLHHCNVDRIYDKYLELEPDSAGEFEAHQANLARQGKVATSTGFPEGSWGPYVPFYHPKTGAPFHARDTFDAPALGYRYDALPPTPKPQMREPPFYVVFPEVDVTKMVMARLLYVYVLPSTKWEPPKDLSDTEALLDHPSFGGLGSIFFLAIPAKCGNCETRPTFDVKVDVTAALRRQSLHPKNCVIKVVIQNEEGPPEEWSKASPVPEPVLRGPTFTADVAHGSADNDAGDVDALKQILIADGVPVAELANDDDVFAAVKRLQKAAGLVADGIVGPKTKALLTMGGLRGDSEVGERPAWAQAGSEVKWTVAAATVPLALKKQGGGDIAGVVKELGQAFDVWGEVTKITFTYVESGAADVTVSWEDQTQKNANAFDGPGGMLANATASSVTFDAAEWWELQSVAHPRKGGFSTGDAFWDARSYFKLLPVAIHEVGHVLGLTHSTEPGDVMSPYYMEGQTTLSDGDKQRVTALLAHSA